MEAVNSETMSRKELVRKNQIKNQKKLVLILNRRKIVVEKRITLLVRVWNVQ